MFHDCLSFSIAIDKLFPFIPFHIYVSCQAATSGTSLIMTTVKKEVRISTMCRPTRPCSEEDGDRWSGYTSAGLSFKRLLFMFSVQPKVNGELDT